MRVVCAWCGSLRRGERGPISHGICETCSALFERAYLRALAERSGRKRARVRPPRRAGAFLPGFGEGEMGGPAASGTREAVTSAGAR